MLLLVASKAEPQPLGRDEQKSKPEESFLAVLKDVNSPIARLLGLMTLLSEDGRTDAHVAKARSQLAAAGACPSLLCRPPAQYNSRLSQSGGQVVQHGLSAGTPSCSRRL